MNIDEVHSEVNDVLWNEGYAFLHKKMDENLRQEFLNLEFDKASEDNTNEYLGEMEVPMHTFEIRDKRADLMEALKNHVAHVDGIHGTFMEKAIQERGYECFAHYFVNGEEFYSHLDDVNGFDFYIITYITEDDNYYGRELIYRHGVEGELKIHKPKDGDICIFDARQDGLWHGVFRQLSDHKVISAIIGVKEE